MAISDIFKKKKTKKKSVKKTEPVVVKPEKKVIKSQAFKVLAKPHITEKAASLEEKNKYIFEIFDKANKTEVKKAVESLYGVDVEKVNIINIPRKKRRAGKKGEGWREAYKKAIVRIQKDQKIEIMPR